MLDIYDLKITVPEDVREILRVLRDNGFEAYIVGGCVRDAILGKEPKDWDITTSALPEQVKSLFSNTVDTGIQHGTVMVIRHGIGYEVTTYRIDGEYKDGRHPESVTFTRSLAEDLKRRDFTINAFAYNPETGIIDLFDGISDLSDQLIRAVGDPNARFDEDALRIMRAIRFSAQLSFKIETVTRAAIARHSENLAQVSMERIRVEFEKTLLSPNPEKVNLFRELVMDRFLIPDPEIRKKCFDPAANESYRLLSGEEERLRPLRLAAFFQNVSSEQARSALKTLKYDNKTISSVSSIIRNKDRVLNNDKVEIKTALCEMGEEIFSMLLDFQEAVAGRKGFLDPVRETKDNILKENEPYCLSKMEINGSDLINAGFPKGERIGELLNILLKAVIEDPAMNRKEELLKLAGETQQGGTNGGVS